MKVKVFWQNLSSSGKEKVFLIFLFGFSLILRLIYLLQVSSNPHFDSPTLDPLYHDIWAQQIAGGDFLGDAVFFRAPLYPYFLAVIYAIFGHSYVIPRIFQHIIGSLSCILIYFFAKKIFDRKTAIVSGILASIYPVFIYFEDELLLDFLLVFFNTLLLWILLKAKEKLSLKYFFLSGIILGLSAITRPNILVFIPFAALWIYLVSRKICSFRNIIKFLIAFGLGIVLIILPVTLRNYLVGKDLVLIASQGGVNFYIGNNPEADGVSAILPEFGDDWDYKEASFLAEKSLNRELKSSEVSSFYYQKGLEFIKDNPGDFFKLLLKKLYLFWNKFEISNNQDLYFFKNYSSAMRILVLGFWFVGPLSLAGMILALKEKKAVGLVLTFVFCYMSTVLAFFVTARYRLAVLSFLVILAGYSLVWIYERIKSKNHSGLFLFFASLILGAFLVNSNFYHLKVGNFAQSHFAIGNVYLKKGDLQNAKLNFEEALTRNATLPRAHLNLGTIYVKEKDFDNAEAEFKAELSINPQEEKALNNLSVIYRLQKLYPQAVEMAQAAIQKNPLYTEAVINLATAYEEQKQIAKAISSYLEGLRFNPDSEMLHYYLGSLYLKQKDKEKAQKQFFEATARVAKGLAGYDPSSFISTSGTLQNQLSGQNIRALAHYNLGVLLAEEEKYKEAEEYFQTALNLKPDFPEAYGNLGTLYLFSNQLSKAIPNLQNAIRLSPFKPLYHYNYALALARTGNFSLALAELEKTLQIDSTFTPAKQRKKQLLEFLKTQKKKG